MPRKDIAHEAAGNPGAKAQVLDAVLAEANKRQDIVDATSPQGLKECLITAGVAGMREAVTMILAAMDKADDPQWDGTDGAHPVWWRGQDDGVRGACRKIEAVLNGKPHTGKCASDDLQRVLDRLAEKQWISVAERLPEVADWYFFLRPDKTACSVYFLPSDGLRWVQLFSYSHWTPRNIPPPPKDK